MNGIDVLVVTYNSAATIGRCLASVPTVAAGSPVRVYVWDNASQDGTAEAVRAASPAAPTLYESPGNVGFPAACNRLLAASSGEVVCLLNPDVELAPGTLEALVQLVETDETIGLATCRLETPDGRAQREAARPRPTLRGVVVGSLGGGALRRRLGAADDLAADRDVECAMGALLVARREVLERLGGLDDSVFMYLEDIDLSRRVRAAGLRIRYLGTVVARHQSGVSRRGMEPFLDSLGPLIWITYFSRYGSRGERLALRPALALMYLSRAVAALAGLRPASARVWLANAVRCFHVEAAPLRRSASARALVKETAG